MLKCQNNMTLLLNAKVTLTLLYTVLGSGAKMPCILGFSTVKNNSLDSGIN